MIIITIEQPYGGKYVCFGESQSKKSWAGICKEASSSKHAGTVLLVDLAMLER